MGNVNISIDLVGPHGNNGNENDAERMAAEFVVQLQRRGHHIIAARVTSGGADDITEAAVFLQGLDERAERAKGGG